MLTQSAGTTQPTPAAQAGQASPPQSTPVSAPFFTPSLQAGGRHVPLPQTWLEQSEDVLHASPVAQGGQIGPPQSMAVSAPSSAPSLQEMQAGQRAPPQSTPVSSWFWTPSEQVAQAPLPAQTPALQASPVVHGSPSSQAVPFAATGLEHAPVAGSQLPAG